jgi:hypothetical protein
MAFGLHDPQTLCHLTSFCGDFLKKRSTTTTQEAWRTLNITMNRLFLALTKLVRKLQKTVKGVIAHFKEGGGDFHHLLSFKIVYHFLGVFEKVKIKIK